MQRSTGTAVRYRFHCARVARVDHEHGRVEQGQLREHLQLALRRPRHLQVVPHRAQHATCPQEQTA
eukprot:scaffold2176_cov350-Prasinococcus_capsulatus_cf.AAC.6